MFRIGHRGACGYEMENSLSSFAKAIELNVDMIELDVQACKSGELIVFHDKKLGRTTDDSGKLSEKTLSELRKVKLKNGERIPTLEEVLDLIDRRVMVNIELKGKKTARPAYKVIKNYIQKNNWTKDLFYISSSRKKEIREFLKLKERFKLGFIPLRKRPWTYFGIYRFAKKNELHFLSVFYKCISSHTVLKSHRKGLEVWAWTVNEKKDIERISELNVDGIISDFPDRI